MSLADFAASVNELETKRCEALNARIPKPMFQAVHLGWPDSMLNYYYVTAHTPESAHEEITRGES